jgi:hypothetical protein
VFLFLRILMAISIATPLALRATAELELRSRIGKETANPEGSQNPFQKQYMNDPVAFVHDCIRWKEGEGPANYQDAALSELIIYHRESLRSPHGAGKTGLVGWAVLWFSLVNDGWTDWKIPITASAWRQLTKFALPEVHKWARRLKWDKIGREPFNERTELTQLSLKLKTGEAFALASDNSALIEGAHASKMMYVFDESKEIPVATWDSAEGAFSAGECFWLAVSTPGEPVGRFYDIQSHKPGYDDWHTKHIALEDVISAGRVSKSWAESRRLQWGEQSAVYQNRVKGEFASSEADGVIPLSWIEAANDRWDDWFETKPELTFVAVGADIARSGEDKTVLGLRWGMVLTELRVTSKEDTMQTTGRVKGILDAHGGKAMVDVIGIGAGVVDRLREMKDKNDRKYNIVAFNASEHTDYTDKSGEMGFINCRSASWWHLRELLDPAAESGIALPKDDMLTGDLVAPHWKVTSGGKIQVEAKEDIKERIGRSTDYGDAVVMAFFDNNVLSLQNWTDALKKHTK